MKTKSTHHHRLDKLRAVIISCETPEQLHTLERYCKLFIEQCPQDKLQGIADTMLDWMKQSNVARKHEVNAGNLRRHTLSAKHQRVLYGY